ncbi:MAG: helix-turn-helix transcriptional regulator [Hyphomicrobium sp.]|jgi:transcriptional regulator with XRE-family HTH domain
MTGDELNDIRTRLGLSTSQLGYALGFSGSKSNVSTTIRRFEHGEKPVPPWIARLALMFERYGIPNDFLAPDESEPTPKR